MAMLPVEQVEFFRCRALKCAEAARKFVREGNHGAAVTNIRNACRGGMMDGLIAWRHQLGSPVAAFANLVEFAKWALAEMSAGPVDPATELGLERVLYAAALLGGQREFVMEALVRAVRNPVALSPVQAVDYDLVARIIGEPMAFGKEQAMRTLQKEKRTVLAADTYASYERVLAHAQLDEAQADALVQEENALFKRRRRDAFYANLEQTEGGGPDNDDVVDYRFAAIAEAVNLKASVPTPHWWSWKTK